MRIKNILLALLLTVSLPCLVMAESKDEIRISYVLKNAGLDKEMSAKLRPLLVAYYQDMAQAKASHKALKDKLKSKEDAGKLTAAEADQLFDSKQKQEAAQLEVVKKHYPIFKTILPAPTAYKVIKLCGDKVK